MSGCEKGKISIRTALQKGDEELYHRLENIWVAIAREIQERQQSKEGHQQGPLHCGMVEDNLGKLIPDDQKSNFFTPLELFLFSSAACYHDIGKSIVSKKKHGEIAMDEMLDRAKNYGLTDPEGLVLSYIVGAHDSEEVFNEVPEIYHVANEDVRVRLLSSLLRLADILHSDNSRIPHTQVGDAKKEDEKTRFRKLIPGWGFDKNSQIELTAVPENYNDPNIIQNGVSMMQKEIECIASVLQDAGYPYKISIHYDNRKLKRKAEERTRHDLLEMDYYTEKEASIFRGRKIESQELLDKVFMSKVSGNYTTLLIGNSGVGKTSLIMAGLFPTLINMGWKCIWTRPLNPDPLKRIFEDINNACMMDNSSSGDIFSCIKNLSDNSAGTGVLISFDQFEDILRSQPHEREEIGKILRRIYSKSFRNVHVLLSYRGDYEPDIFSFLESASIIRPEKYSLRGFDRQIASDVLRELFRDNNIGIDDALLVNILNEIDKKSEIGGIYPPFIQIIAKSLIESAKSKDGVVTEEIYCNKGKVEDIIGSYLISQLTYFDTLSPPKAKFAEEILKQLVRDRTKEQKGKDELLRYLMLPENELQELLDLMVKKRLIRHLGNDNYEIIHDYLASGVEEMIKDDEKPLRSVISTLRTKTLSYQHIHSLLDVNELVSLYSLKESIHPSNQEKELLMYSYLARNGPAWWWFREDKDVLRTFIKKGLSNRSGKVRSASVVLFEKLGTQDDLEIIKNMLMDNDSNVRSAAVSAIGKFGTHDDLEIVKNMLKDNDSNVRSAAVSVFEILGTHDDLKIIKNMLMDNYWIVKSRAISVFKKFGTQDDLAIIKNMLKDDNSEVREMGVLIFEILGTHDDVTIIKNMLKDDNFEVRSRAISAIGKLGTHDDLEIIIDIFRNSDDDPDSKEAARSTFIKLVTNEDLEIIKNMLKDNDSDARYVAVSAIGKFGTHDDLDIIKNMLKDDDYEVRHAAVSAFEKLTTHDNFEIVKNMLKDDNSDVRYAAVSAIRKLGTHDDLEIVKNMLKDDDSYVRRVAVSAYEKLGTHEDLEIVKNMLKDDNSDVRRAAVSAYEKLVTHEDLEIVKNMLKDDNSDMRRTAVSVLEKFANEEDLKEIARKFANNEIHNNETLNCIISLDEKLFSTKKEVLSLHKIDSW
ncbi:MAG: HEAT repeat domain-containing protein [Candidatus Methanoperedens sp.]|nr:HEAT repeat domain-containing protein [Candidatus Methanoperedens sp.]